MAIGIYGDMLDAFPELFRPVLFWEGQSVVGSGYIPETAVTYNVIILADNQAQFQAKRLGEYQVTDICNHDVMYTYTSTPIKQGMFLKHPDTGEIFRIDVALDYSFTGGFQAWTIDRVQGANSTNQTPVSLKDGVY